MIQTENEIPKLILAQFEKRNKITIKQLHDAIDHDPADISLAARELYKTGQLDRRMDHGSFVYTRPAEPDPVPQQPKKPKPKPAPKAEPEPEPKQHTTRRKPFSVTETTGFKTDNGKVTLFLDRKLHASSITLSADRLKVLAEMASTHT